MSSGEGELSSYVIKPRKRGYRHRDVIAIAGGRGLTDQYERIDDVPGYLLSHPDSPHVIFTSTPEYLLDQCLRKYRDDGSVKVKFLIPDSVPDGPGFSEARVGRILIEPADSRRKRTMHSVFDPSRAFGLSRINQWKDYNAIASLLRLAIDIRDWCKSENIPFGQSFPSIASSLAKDARFWPENRRPVPRATNRRLRGKLPGIYQVRSHPRNVVIQDAVALDQTRAFHNVVQTIGVPDRNTLYARGFFGEPENPENLWAPRDSDTYRDIAMESHGLVAAVVTRPKRSRNKFENPVTKSISHIGKPCVRYIWTNELPDIEREGVRVWGLTAAWTAESADEGFARYGKYAEEQILASDAFRREWLKPCLHCVYGLMGARERQFTVSSNATDSGDHVTKIISGFPFECNEIRIRGGPSLTNVAVLGVLQSEIRRRTLVIANRYSDRVTHIHADGLHLSGEVIPNIPPSWTAERVTNLVYLDNVSYISDERDVLPGRYGKQRVIERRNAIASVRRHSEARRRTANVS